MRDQWTIPDDVTYLNHGSFGPSPRFVQTARQEWTARLEQQPMNFFLREMEEALDDAHASCAKFVGADPRDIVFVENATAAMNIVAANVELNPGDEVLTTDHEYGAVLRLWRSVCRRANATLVVRKLPRPFESTDEVVDVFMQAVTSRTRLILVSHVTSPTAVILPVAEICRRANELGIPVCIDGPHAVAMLPLDFETLGCDFYAASCHKWLSAPFGSGFLFVRRKRQQDLRPVITSWRGSLEGRTPSWKDEFNWIGTRDPSAFLAVPAAIKFLQTADVDRFRSQSHELAQYAAKCVSELTGIEPIIPDSPDWYGSMISLPIPIGKNEPPKQGHRDPLQDQLWEQYRIEIPIVHWQGIRFARISCHLYNTRDEVDKLINALQSLLNR